MSPACSTGPIPSRQCPRWCPLPTGRASGSCWTTEPQLLRDGELLASLRTLDLRRGMLLSDLSYRTHAGITISGERAAPGVIGGPRGRHCSCCGSRSIATGSTSCWRPISAWPVSGWSRCGLSGYLAPGERKVPTKLSRWRETRHCGPVAIAGPGAAVLAALGLALAFRCRAGARTRSHRGCGAFRQLGRMIRRR